mmetsp:Transcript_10030/g.32200  ORF Transcript_10030/g.32200 Transcript_10030/m.32200 type:complete len:287 (+) Transcript_10030:385-1245(+)
MCADRNGKLDTVPSRVADSRGRVQFRVRHCSAVECTLLVLAGQDDDVDIVCETTRSRGRKGVARKKLLGGRNEHHEGIRIFDVVDKFTLGVLRNEGGTCGRDFVEVRRRQIGLVEFRRVQAGDNGAVDCNHGVIVASEDPEDVSCCPGRERDCQEVLTPRIAWRELLNEMIALAFVRRNIQTDAAAKDSDWLRRDYARSGHIFVVAVRLKLIGLKRVERNVVRYADTARSGVEARRDNHDGIVFVGDNHELRSTASREFFVFLANKSARRVRQNDVLGAEESRRQA